MAAIPDIVVTLEEADRQHRRRVAAFTTARELLYGLDIDDPGDFLVVADWLLTGSIDALLRRDQAAHARYLASRSETVLSDDAATWSPTLVGDGTGGDPLPDA